MEEKSKFGNQEMENANEALGKTLSTIMSQLIAIRAQQEAAILIITSNMGFSSEKILEIQGLINKVAGISMERIKKECGL